MEVDNPSPKSRLPPRAPKKSQKRTILQDMFTKKTDTIVSFKGQNITKVTPKDVEKYLKCLGLDFSHNLLIFTEELCQAFRYIRYLNLSHNQLTRLPQDVHVMQNLAVLDISSNQISKLPLSMYQMKGLEWIDIRNNPFLIAWNKRKERDSEDFDPQQFVVEIHSFLRAAKEWRDFNLQNRSQELAEFLLICPSRQPCLDDVHFDLSPQDYSQCPIFKMTGTSPKDLKRIVAMIESSVPPPTSIEDTLVSYGFSKLWTIVLRSIWLLLTLFSLAVAFLSPDELTSLSKSIPLPSSFLSSFSQTHTSVQSSKVNDALIQQAKQLWHSANIHLNSPVHEYASKLAETLPGDLKVVYPVNSGSEANDLAILMARVATGNFDVISLRNGYHGMSPLTMGLTGHSTWKQTAPHYFGFHHTMLPDCYNGLWAGCRDSPVQPVRTCEGPSCDHTNCSTADKYVKQLNELFMYTLPQRKVAGFFIESIQGVGGVVQYPKGYVRKAFELVRENGGVCVSDEVQTGFGRTGDNFWHFQDHGVVPDIVTMAKGIANGFPFAAVVTTPKIAQSLFNAHHFNTFGGNPMGCAVASAVLDVIKEEKLQENCKKLGTYMIQELGKLREEAAIVGDVRGKGLMIGIELVKDKETREPLPADKMLTIFEDLKNAGLIVGRGGFYGNTFRLSPPMCITKEDADSALDIMRRLFIQHSK